MKNTYQHPQTTVVSVALQPILAGSPSSLTTEGDNLIQDLNNAPTTDKTSGNLSRRSLWDDEEE